MFTTLMRSSTAVLLSATIVAMGTNLASAGPFDPAYRGDANSIHAIFDWVASATDWEVSVFETGPSQFPLDPTEPAASDDGTDTSIILPNFIDPLPLKQMRIQMFFDGPVSGDLIGLEVFAFDPEDAIVNFVGGSGPVDSNVHFIDIEIVPNPDWEQIIIFGNTGGNVIPGNLLTIEIDTVSIPEPSTLTLAVLTLFGLVGYGRRLR